MIDDRLRHYLTSTLSPQENWITDMEQHAKVENIPIMDQISINFLLQLIRIGKPKKILEIGTAIGYSALRMHAAFPSTSIVTIERDKDRYHQAVHNIKRQKRQNNIDVIHGEAIETLHQLAEKERSFDLVFIDAAKGKYKQFFQLASPLVTNNGIILSDNVLFKGFVAGSIKIDPKYKKIVSRIRDYNEWLVKHPDYITSIVPIGDGIAISVKKQLKKITDLHE